MSTVYAVGRFPPVRRADARDGALGAPAQSVFDVRRIDTQLPGEVHSLDRAVSSGRARRYLGLRGRLREALTQAPGAPVLRHAILPTALDHWRDVLAALPAIGPATRSTP